MIRTICILVLVSLASTASATPTGPARVVGLTPFVPGVDVITTPTGFLVNYSPISHEGETPDATFHDPFTDMDLPLWKSEIDFFLPGTPGFDLWDINFYPLPGFTAESVLVDAHGSSGIQGDWGGHLPFENNQVYSVLIWVGDSYGFSVQAIGPFAVPEPGTMALLALGICGLGVVRKRQLLRASARSGSCRAAA